MLRVCAANASGRPAAGRRVSQLHHGRRNQSPSEPHHRRRKHSSWLVSLFSAGAASNNTGVGTGALALNTADSNTATGVAALILNTSGARNTANGAGALVNNDSGTWNGAVGAFALTGNIDGSRNNAFGESALEKIFMLTITQPLVMARSLVMTRLETASQTLTPPLALTHWFPTLMAIPTLPSATRRSLPAGSPATRQLARGRLRIAFGGANTALGADALGSTTSGNLNTAIGTDAIFDNTSGSNNTAVGNEALVSNTTGDGNTAVGDEAGNAITSGSHNVVVGDSAGLNVTMADNVICIGASVGGADVSNTSWIGNVYGVTTQSGTTAAVIVSDTGQLGTVASSERFKKDIAAMDKASETILSLDQSHSTTRPTPKAHRNLV